MNTLTLPARDHGPAGLLQEALARDRRLTVFAMLLLAAMMPALLALGLDDRVLRGVSVWVKPLKFMASIALFSLSTAWFAGLLPKAVREGRVMSAIAWTIIGAGSFEAAYITLQAALGQASHYNLSDLPHQLLYQAMGAGALAMTATQPVLAWLIVRHAPERGLWREGVVLALVLTFVLGAGAGGLLGGLPPPPTAGIPLFGWHFGADLRPAHFIGMHVQQLLPLAAWAWRKAPPAVGRRRLWALAALSALAWAAAVALGLQGATPLVWMPR